MQLLAVRAPLHRIGFDFIRYDTERFPKLRRPPLLRDRASTSCWTSARNKVNTPKTCYAPATGTPRLVRATSAGIPRTPSATPPALRGGRPDSSRLARSPAPHHSTSPATHRAVRSCRWRHVTLRARRVGLCRRRAGQRSQARRPSHGVRAARRPRLAEAGRPGLRAPRVEGRRADTRPSRRGGNSSSSLVELYEGQGLLGDVIRPLASMASARGSSPPSSATR